jgi:hypothetical protein
MGVNASVGPAAREVFRQLDGQSFNTPEEFGEAFGIVLARLGSMPRFFSPEEAIDWASRHHHLTVDYAGVIRVSLNGHNGAGRATSQ